MKWIEKCCIEEYGKKKWEGFADQEQVDIIFHFCENLRGAFEFLQKIKNKLMDNNYPIKGKWYKVIKGPYKGFIGECVSFNINESLPIILQDMSFNSKAVKLDEVKENIKQPSKTDLTNEQFN